MTELYSLFATPVAYFEHLISEDECYSVCDQLLETQFLSHACLSLASSSHASSLQNNVIKDSLGESLLFKIQEKIDEYSNVCGLHDLTITNMWHNVQERGSVLKNHRHPNSKVSGVLFLDVDEDSSKLYIENPNPFVKFEDYAEENQFNFYHTWFQPKRGDLILFPSWMEHGSNNDENKSDRRISVSFNTHYK